MTSDARKVDAGDSRRRGARSAARSALAALTRVEEQLDRRQLIRLILRLMTIRGAHSRDMLDEPARRLAVAMREGDLAWRSLAAHRFEGLALLDVRAVIGDAAMSLACERVASDEFAWLDEPDAPDLLGRAYEELLAFDGEESEVRARRSRRRTGGSYYTPAPLIEHLLDLALEPTVASSADASSIRLLDPSCGGGHFLLAAARRLTMHLRQASPDLSREEAMARVISRCVYGVDLDTDAVEVSIVALWLEASTRLVTPVMLSRRIRCGHALLGLSPASRRGDALDARMLPDEAFEARDDDEPLVAAMWQERNRAERADRHGAPDGACEAGPTRLAADAWCTAFLASKRRGETIPTTAAVRAAMRGEPLEEAMRTCIETCAASRRFLHWAIEFPEVWRPGDSSGGFDVIVGNPPFLNQLETATVTSRREEALMRAVGGGELRGYTDRSAAFLLRASRLVAPGGRVALVQPQSLLAAKDARQIRGAVLDGARLEAIWTSNERIFEGASVFTCAPVLHATGRPFDEVRRTAGAEFRELEPARISDASLRSAETWAPLAAAAAGVPEVRTKSSGVIGDLAVATADFRDQYYGLDGFLVEDESLGERSDRASHPAIITSGLIDAASLLWGDVSTRILKRAWRAPRVDRVRMEREGSLARWMSQRLVPKVLLATQTRVMEAIVDERGELLPCTPVITLTPRDANDLWLVAAALCSPVAAAAALERYSGAAMTADAIKVSAKQVMGLPLPLRGGAWTSGAERFMAATRATDATSRRRELEAYGRVMCDAYGLGAGEAERVFEWWRGRFRPRKRRAAR